MHPRHLQVPITLAYAKGGYTARLELGSAGVANVLLDTGSSTLAVLPRAYDPDADPHRACTSYAQQVSYGQGAWAGPVLRSKVAFGHGEHSIALDAAHFAYIETDAQNFRDADGILGLAYGGLNHAHDFEAWLQQQGYSPASTWPWPFSDDDSDPKHFHTLSKQQPRVDLTPLFSALEEQGIVADRFALTVRRALVHVLDEQVDDAGLFADPLNRGWLLLGIGDERTDLYHGPMQSVRILHDLYYNANLIAVQVGDGPRIAAPALQPEHQAGYASNAILDTGSSFVLLESSLYDAVLSAFAAIGDDLPALIDRFRAGMADERGIPNDALDLARWPTLHFWLEGEDGGEVRISCPPEHYWERNALHAGEAWFLLLSQLPDWPNQSILGLPLMCGHYCVFDRRVDGLGVFRIAPAAR